MRGDAGGRSCYFSGNMCPDDGSTEPEDPQSDGAVAGPTEDGGSDPAPAADEPSQPAPSPAAPVVVEELPLPPPPPESVPLPQDVPRPAIVPSAVVTDVSPDAGPTVGGTRITLDGDHLHRESIVRVGDVLATTIGAAGGRQLRVTAPPHERAGTVDITIQNPGSALTVLEKAYRYEPLPAPKIDTVAPNHAAAKGGTELTITGRNFLADTQVLLDGTVASQTVFVDATTLEVKTPGGKTGKMVDVEVKNPDGKSDRARRAFAYDDRY